MNRAALSSDAHKAVTEFVNAQHCQTRADVLVALRELALKVAKALDVVEHGKMEKLS